jgi:peptidoglycan/xylan/chitin deacetylase (PgdA/CDA1 family)
MRARIGFILSAFLIFPPAWAGADETCPRAGTLGISRTVEVDTTGGPGFGTEHYKAYDFLQDKEVVLTFDDGPQKYSTEAVLKALADECVKATFFSIGKMALGYPEIIREVAKAGHTVGTHTWSHKAIGKLKTFDDGRAEIERGISAVHRAVGGPIAPFFRFPTLVDTPEAVAYLGKRNIAMFSADIDSVDYRRQSVDHLIKSVMQKLDKRGKGIILMHDIHKRTAKALPVILAQLKAKGYKIVHMTPKAPVVTLAEYDETIEKEAKGLPQVGAERPLSSIVKTVGGTPPKNEAADSASTENEESEPEGMPASSLPAFPSAAPPATVPDASSPSPPASGSLPDSEKHSENGAPDSGSATNDPAVPAAGMSSRLATQHTADSASAPPGSTAPASPAQAASVVRTVSADEVRNQAAAEPSPGNMAPVTAHEAPKAPHKSLMERAKETWKLWFGE